MIKGLRGATIWSENLNNLLPFSFATPIRGLLRSARIREYRRGPRRRLVRGDVVSPDNVRSPAFAHLSLSER
jgi:hypothetical protein